MVRGVRGGIIVAAAAVLIAVAGCGHQAETGGAGDTPSATTSKPSSASATPTQSSAQPTRSPSPSPSGPPMLLDTIAPADHATVGVGMPIVVRFSKPVKPSARKHIEKALKLSASKPVTGAWHWFGTRQVDFRPKHYWPTGTHVELDAQMKHVPDGNGRYGRHAYKHRFTIGDRFETKISVPRHTTAVYHGHKLVKTMPADAGSPDFPSWNGTMAVVGKVRNQHMTSCKAGITCNKHSPDYYDGHYPYAVRLTNSGTFLHYSKADPQPGNSHGSHGCIHLSRANAKWYFHHIKIGDPVTITGSHRSKADPDNGYAVWNLSWKKWKSQHSALGPITTHHS